MTEEKDIAESGDGLDGMDEVAREINPASLVGEIERALAGAEGRGARPSDNSFSMSLSTAISLLPRQYVREADLQSVGDDTIDVGIKDLFGQLLTGKVEMPVADLAFFIPLHLIYRAALDDQQIIRLPVQSVVRSLGIMAFRQRTPKEIRFYDIVDMEDPFREAEAAQEESVGIILEEEPQAKVEEKPPVELAPPPAAQEEAKAEEKPETVVDTKKAAVRTRRTLARKTIVEEAKPVAVEAPSPQPAVVAPPAPAVKPVEPAVAAPTPAPAGQVNLEYPIAHALDSIPKKYLIAGAVEPDRSQRVGLDIPDLFVQLRRGKVNIPLAALATAMPPGLVSEEARKDSTTVVNLPLGSVVAFVGVEQLKQMTPTGKREYDIDRMADPFKEPEVLPKLVRGEKAKHRDVVEQGESMGGQPSAESVMTADTQVTEHVKVSDSPLDLSYREIPGNVNINSTTVEELMLFPGVTETLAKAILKRGDRPGGFKSIFELMEVPGVDVSLFQQMTGMDVGPNHYHRRNRLAGLLGIHPQKVSDLQLVARTIAGKPGLSGCVISDNEGLLLAEGGDGKVAVGMTAVLPRILREIRHDMELIEEVNVETMSLSIGGKFYTVSAGGNVILTVLHANNMLSEIELSFVRKVRRDLTWLLSFRAFAGPRV